MLYQVASGDLVMLSRALMTVPSVPQCQMTYLPRCVRMSVSWTRWPRPMLAKVAKARLKVLSSDTLLGPSCQPQRRRMVVFWRNGPINDLVAGMFQMALATKAWASLKRDWVAVHCLARRRLPDVFQAGAFRTL